MEGGNTLEDCLEYLKYLEKEVDVFDVSCGLNGSIQYQIDANHFPDGWRSYMAKAVKERFGKPCVTMGNIRDPHIKVEFGDICDIRKSLKMMTLLRLSISATA